MKNTKLLPSIALASLLLVSACGKKTEVRSNKLAPETISVKVMTIQSTESGHSISATGLISTEKEARYGFKIGGVIDRIYVNEGQSFKKGDLLASLKLTEIEAGLAQAKLGLQKAQRDYQRVSKLYADSVATLEQLQNTQTALDLAQKQVDAVAFNKQYAHIYAANDGFVTKKIANEGEIIAPGSAVLAINENTGTAWVLKVGLSDKDWAAVALGNTATVRIDAFPDQVFKAVVSKKALAAEQSSGSFVVELRLETEDAKPAVGMYAKAEIATGQSSQTPSIPYDALIEANGNKAFVFVPAGQNKVKKVPVHIQSFDNTAVRIASGLENVREVVVANTAFLNEQSTINIVK